MFDRINIESKNKSDSMFNSDEKNASRDVKKNLNDSTSDNIAFNKSNNFNALHNSPDKNDGESAVLPDDVKKDKVNSNASEAPQSNSNEQNLVFFIDQYELEKSQKKDTVTETLTNSSDKSNKDQVSNKAKNFIDSDVLTSKDCNTKLAANSVNDSNSKENSTATSKKKLTEESSEVASTQIKNVRSKLTNAINESATRQKQSTLNSEKTKIDSESQNNQAEIMNEDLDLEAKQSEPRNKITQTKTEQINCENETVLNKQVDLDDKIIKTFDDEQPKTTNESFNDKNNQTKAEWLNTDSINQQINLTNEQLLSNTQPVSTETRQAGPMVKQPSANNAPPIQSEPTVKPPSTDDTQCVQTERISQQPLADNTGPVQTEIDQTGLMVEQPSIDNTHAGVNNSPRKLKSGCNELNDKVDDFINKSCTTEDSILNDPNNIANTSSAYNSTVESNFSKNTESKTFIHDSSVNQSFNLANHTNDVCSEITKIFNVVELAIQELSKNVQTEENVTNPLHTLLRLSQITSDELTKLNQNLLNSEEQIFDSLLNKMNDLTTNNSNLLIDMQMLEQNYSSLLELNNKTEMQNSMNQTTVTQALSEHNILDVPQDANYIAISNNSILEFNDELNKKDIKIAYLKKKLLQYEKEIESLKCSQNDTQLQQSSENLNDILVKNNDNISQKNNVRKIETIKHIELFDTSINNCENELKSEIKNFSGINNENTNSSSLSIAETTCVVIEKDSTDAQKLESKIVKKDDAENINISEQQNAQVETIQKYNELADVIDEIPHEYQPGSGDYVYSKIDCPKGFRLKSEILLRNS
uniref:TNF receptor-associated factor family protein DDB_G0272098-like n=1 Tax=Dermatophagoides pteronyssinus TaxID=6956 RepID=A0A6P6XKZ7_DERPT|nr:TNF receptor-associated factor family protein DDB_G0272098-like [Dermatophagoides pteronyssinus]